MCLNFSKPVHHLRCCCRPSRCQEAFPINLSGEIMIIMLEEEKENGKQKRREGVFVKRGIQLAAVHIGCKATVCQTFTSDSILSDDVRKA